MAKAKKIWQNMAFYLAKIWHFYGINFSINFYNYAFIF
jgi:hypothetical protein